MDVSGTYNYTAANREDLRGGKMKRKMPSEKQAARESDKERADRLGKQHMAVAANKARARMSGNENPGHGPLMIKTAKDAYGSLIKALKTGQK